MTTLSVPLPSDLLMALETLVKQGKAPNKATAMREALRLYIEQQAVEDVLKAEREPTLHGDLDDLLKRI